MNIRKRILFIGELPPRTINGISSANSVNINILKSSFDIDIIEELSPLESHNKLSIFKLLQSIKNFCNILQKSLCHRYKYLYLIFHLSTLGCFKSLLAVLCFRLFNSGEIVIHIHRGDFFTRFYVSNFNKLLTKIIFLNVDKIIVLSAIQKINFESKFNITCNILSNTIEIEHIYKLRNINTTNFIFISNYLIEKGILDLLEVFSSLIPLFPFIKLNTYGSFSDPKTKEKILQYSSNNIKINNAIFGENKFNIIQESDCLILPSWTEGQPIVILEAMSVGTPVISTNVGLIPELLGANYPYLTIAKDLDSLEKTIINFLKSNNNNIISNNLHDLYTNNFSHKIHGEEINKYF